jgi:adenylate cyclase
MVSLIGEAGVGKSRLVAELKELALVPTAEPEPLWLEGRSFELGTAAGYAPFVDILHQYFAWGAREADRRRYERITSSLHRIAARGDLAPERIVEISPLLANLVSLRTGDEWEEEIRAQDPEEIRRRTFAAVLDFCLALARQRPVVLVFEDLHWADSLSIDLISLLMEGLRLGPLLLLCAYRPEREHRCWHLATIAAQKCRGRYTELRLRELTPTQSRRLVTSLLRKEALPTTTAQFVLERCQGNPFFIEEAVLSLIDAGIVVRDGDAWRTPQEIVPTAVPESVQSVVLSRIDRLDDELGYVLQTASAIGRVFRRRVLERALQREVDLERTLWELEDRALIYQERAIPEVEYSFRHVLAQETIYQSILRDRRQTYHRRIAEAIQALYQENLDEYCERLAHHHERSGNVPAAIAYLLRAGEKATRSYANEEAVAHLSRAIELLETLPETPERARQELDLQIALGIPLYSVQGQSAPEVGRTYERALELCEQVDDRQQRFGALVGLRRFHFVRGELQVARELAEQMLTLGRQANDPFLLAFSHLAMGATLYWLGEFPQAQAYCEQGITLHASQRRRAQASLYGVDIGISFQLYIALATWHQGRPDRALETGQGALAQARELSHPMTLVYAHHLAGMLYQLRREARAVRELAEKMLELSREHEFAFYETAGLTLRGWALAAAEPQHRAQAEVEQGIGQIREGIAGWRAMEATVMLPYSLAYLAEACAREGKVQEGLDALAEALAIVGTTGCRTWEAELRRLKGELLWAKGDKAQAKVCFQQAIEISRRQQARSWELRAATSLGRLWQKRGKRKDAEDLLQRAYDGFTEGLDTTDLKEAKALLDALA